MLNSYQNATSVQNELVSYSNDQLVTNSLLVAQKFNKNHFHVLRSIRQLISTDPKIGDNSNQNWCQLFASTSYVDESGKANQMFIMNRDGFSLLVMGFTGKDALNFKLEFIEAFNKMEKHLKESAKSLTPAEMFLQNAQLMVEHDRRIATVESKLYVLEAKTTTRPDFFTIVGFGTLRRIKVGLTLASSLGRKATKICNERGIQTDKIPDPRFGEVKMYPASVLEEVFSESLTNKN